MSKTLTPEQIQGLEVAYQRLVDPVVDYLINDIARRVQKSGEFTSTAAYQLYRLQVLSTDFPEVQKQLEKLLETSANDADKLIKKAAEFGYNLDAKRLSSSIKFSEATGIDQIINATVQLARSDLTNITQTIGFINHDNTFRRLTSAYEQAMDEAFSLVSTGAMDYNSAIRRVCSKLNSEGIRVIDYASGVSSSIESAVRRNLISGTGLMVEQISQKNHDEMGANGWEISAHAASAPDHEPIQGKQYSDEEFDALNKSLVRRIGTLNCGHNASPIIIGVSSPQYTNSELNNFRSENKKGFVYEGKKFETIYDATQYQRKLERAIRAQKRRVMTATNDDKAIAKSKLTILRARYKDFSKSANLRTEDERLFVAGFKK